MQFTSHHEMTAVLIARVFLGLLFFFQGYDAVFRIKVRNVINAYADSFSGKGIPHFLTVAGAWFTSYAELIGGALLVLGFLQYPALWLLGTDLVIASIAFGIASPVWDLRFVFPRLALLLFLLCVPAGWNCFAIDELLTCMK